MEKQEKSQIPESCPYADCPCTTEQHREDHDFVRASMRVVAKLDEIKWSTLKAVILVIVVFLGSLLGVGVIQKIKILIG